MICLHCAEATAVDPCHACGHSPLLDRRYRLDWALRRDARVIVWRGTRLADGLAVTLRQLPLAPCGTAPTPEDAQTIERLRGLNHPGVPPHIEHVVAPEGARSGCYLIQAFVAGRTLAVEATGQRLKETTMLRLIAEIGTTLADLHGACPRVVLGDLEPARIIRRAGDGALMLAEFGTAGSGAPDFAAPEHRRGGASVAGDLYMLGLTAAVLLTGQPAARLRDGRGRVDWRLHAEVHPETAALLDGLLARDPADRFDDARRVVAWARQARAAIERDRAAGGPLLPKTLPMIGRYPQPPMARTTAQPTSQPMPEPGAGSVGWSADAMRQRGLRGGLLLMAVVAAASWLLR